MCGNEYLYSYVEIECNLCLYQKLVPVRTEDMNPVMCEAKKSRESYFLWISICCSPNEFQTSTITAFFVMTVMVLSLSLWMTVTLPFKSKNTDLWFLPEDDFFHLLVHTELLFSYITIKNPQWRVRALIFPCHKLWPSALSLADSILGKATPICDHDHRYVVDLIKAVTLRLFSFFKSTTWYLSPFLLRSCNRLTKHHDG